MRQLLVVSSLQLGVSCSVALRSAAMGKSKKAGAVEASFELPKFHNPNEAWQMKVADSLDTIKGQFGEQLKSFPALNEDEGFSAPLSLELARKRRDDDAWQEPILASGGVNVLWDSPLTTHTAAVPINERAVERFIYNLWGQGTETKVVPLTEPVDFRLLSDGTLERISPEEPVQALVVHVAQRIRDGADKDELLQWMKVIFSATGRIVKADTEIDVYFWSINYRRTSMSICSRQA